MATLRSAVKLEQEQQFLIAKKLQELTGSKNIKLKPVVDPELVAGFVVEYGEAPAAAAAAATSRVGWGARGRLRGAPGCACRLRGRPGAPVACVAAPSGRPKHELPACGGPCLCTHAVVPLLVCCTATLRRAAGLHAAAAGLPSSVVTHGPAPPPSPAGSTQIDLSVKGQLEKISAELLATVSARPGRP